MPKVTMCTAWRCGRCRREQVGTVMKCLNCNAPKAEGISLNVLPGDWECLHCRENNFARRVVCFRCGKATFKTGAYCLVPMCMSHDFYLNDTFIILYVNYLSIIVLIFPEIQIKLMTLVAFMLS